MEFQKKLNDAILSTTTLIRKDFPELVTFLNELPAPFPSGENKEISTKDLKNYLDSLNELLKTYSKEQKTITKEKTKRKM